MSAKQTGTMMLKGLTNKISVAVLLLVICVAGRAGAQSLKAVHDPSQGKPVVVSSNPISEEKGVFTDTTIRVTFSKEMSCQTLNAKTLSIFGPPGKKTVVPGTIACGGAVVIFTPSQNLTINTKYSVNIRGHVMSKAGYKLDTGRHWDFTTGAGVRPPATPTPTAFATPTATASATPTATPTASPTATATPTATPTPVPPTVVSNDPPIVGCGGQGMPTNQKVTATFSRAMLSATIIAPGTFTVTGPGVAPVAGTASYDAVNHIAIFAPTGGIFAVSTTFTATITTAATSVGGLPLASNYVWTFKTGSSLDSTAPTVLSTNPVNLSSVAATNQKIIATFNEGMDSTTLTAVSFTVTGPGAVPVPGTVTYSASATTATFTPSSVLIASTPYTASITTAVQDLGGNAMASAFNWTFTTGAGADTVAPTVTTTVPVNGASNVSRTTGINATFSEAMDSATLNASTFLVTKAPGAVVVTGKVTYDPATDTATFTPPGPLAIGATYTGTIKTGATDLEGNALVADFQWIFTVGSSSGLSPIDLGAATNFAVLAQATVTNVVAAGTVVNGDLGLTPGSSVTGFPPGIVNGTIQIDNPPAVAALASLGTAYGIAAGLANPTTIAENLATQVLPPGLYISSANSFEITLGNLTLDAQGDPNAVWVFQMPASTLTLTTPTCNVILINGAKASNVFWQVGSSATIGAGCDLEGTILADTSITLNTGATVNGRALAGAVAPSGAVTMDGNKASLPACN